MDILHSELVTNYEYKTAKKWLASIDKANLCFTRMLYNRTDCSICDRFFKGEYFRCPCASLGVNKVIEAAEYLVKKWENNNGGDDKS